MREKIINPEEIGKHVGDKLYAALYKKSISFTEIAGKLKVSPQSISQLLRGKPSSGNLNRYWAIAECIPISRREFDQIVEEAKQKVLGTGAEITEDTAISFLAREKGVSERDIAVALQTIANMKNK